MVKYIFLEPRILYSMKLPFKGEVKYTSSQTEGKWSSTGDLKCDKNVRHLDEKPVGKSNRVQRKVKLKYMKVGNDN